MTPHGSQSRIANRTVCIRACIRNAAMPDILMACRQVYSPSTRAVPIISGANAILGEGWGKRTDFSSVTLNFFQILIIHTVLPIKLFKRDRVPHGSPGSEFHNYVNVANAVMNRYFSLKEDFEFLGKRRSNSAQKHGGNNNFIVIEFFSTDAWMQH